MLKVVHDEAEPNEASGSVLDEIVREAARQMLAVALQAEVSAYIDAHAEEVDENGHQPLTRPQQHQDLPAPWLGDRVEDVRRRRCSCHGAIIFRYPHASSRRNQAGLVR